MRIVISNRSFVSIVLATVVLTVLHSCWQDDPVEQVLEQLAQRRLNDLNADYDPMSMSQQYNLDLGSAEDVYLPTYTAKLQNAADKTMTPWYLPCGMPSVSRTFDETFDALTFHQEGRFLTYENRSLGPTLEKTIYTVSKNASEVVKPYSSWATFNPDWRFAFYNDKMMDDWLKSYMPSTYLQTVFNNFPRPVMRSDLFRYLLLWQHGGLYTDSDTCAIQPIAQWDTDSTEDWTDPTLSYITAELRRRHLGNDSCLHISECAPKLVVSVESRAQDWHRMHIVGYQVVQWTFGSARGHPVLLDAVQRIINAPPPYIQPNTSAEAQETLLNDDKMILSYTGPGLFANAVWRYLRARWGFDVQRLRGVMHPVRVGDVLIMPWAAFQATYSELDVEQGKEARVWHGANGRWRKQDRPS